MCGTFVFPAGAKLSNKHDEESRSALGLADPAFRKDLRVDELYPTATARFGESDMTLTSGEAQALIDAASAAAEAFGLPISIAVIDQKACLVAFRRMDGAARKGSDLAIERALAAAEAENESQNPPQLLRIRTDWGGIEHHKGASLIFAAGLLVRSLDGEMVGAIGVSGRATASCA
jgi:uncharacterized protein GlcG (DUF336 family)